LLTGGRVIKSCELELELELELIQNQMTQKPMLRAEVGMRVRCANKASAECIMQSPPTETTSPRGDKDKYAALPYYLLRS